MADTSIHQILITNKLQLHTGKGQQYSRLAPNWTEKKNWRKKSHLIFDLAVSGNGEEKNLVYIFVSFHFPRCQ